MYCTTLPEGLDRYIYSERLVCKIQGITEGECRGRLFGEAPPFGIPFLMLESKDESKNCSHAYHVTTHLLQRGFTDASGDHPQAEASRGRLQD